MSRRNRRAHLRTVDQRSTVIGSSGGESQIGLVVSRHADHFHMDRHETSTSYFMAVDGVFISSYWRLVSYQHDKFTLLGRTNAVVAK